MFRVAVLLLAWSFSALCAYKTEGFELPQPLKRMGDWLPSGYSQSPIEFNMFEMVYKPYDPESNGLKITYRPAISHLYVERDDTLAVKFQGPAGAFIEGGVTYRLKQFHLHVPPEHKFKQYPLVCDFPRDNLVSGTAKQADTDKESVTTDTNHNLVMEMHLVHESARGKIAVIGVLFKLGAPSKFLNKFWSYMPKVNETGVSVGLIDMNDLNVGDTFIRYSGSLTTPPYTEDVLWTVMCGNWNTMSPRQLSMYKTRFPKANNREIQATNRRKVELHFPVYWPDNVEPEIQLEGAALVQSS